MFKKPFVKVAMAAALSILLFIMLAFFIKQFLLPLLPTEWQGELVWVSGAAIATVGILAGLAQITGYSIKDLFSPDARQSTREDDIQGAIVLTARAGEKIEWNGDILQDHSTKIVVDRPSLLETQVDRQIDIDGLTKDIQEALYDDNKRFPYVLTLCLDLCDRVGLREKYSRWLRRELSGYRDYAEFQKEFDSQEQFRAWMDNWASHRLIKPYIKALNYSSETMRSEVLTLRIHEIRIGLSVAEIARMIEDARENGRLEFARQLASIGREHLDRVKSVFAEVSPGSQVPSDLPVFFTVSDLEQVLDGVRNLVLSLLSDARSLAA